MSDRPCPLFDRKPQRAQGHAPDRRGTERPSRSGCAREHRPIRCILHVASASCATIPDSAGSAMSDARVGSRAPRSIHCSQRRRSVATAARSSMRSAGAPASASSSPTGLSQRNCLPGYRRANCGRRSEWRAKSKASAGAAAKRSASGAGSSLAGAWSTPCGPSIVARRATLPSSFWR